MRRLINGSLLLVACAMHLSIGAAESGTTGREISTTTADGVTLFGEYYTSERCRNGPLVLMFHQAGSNGRGEYETLATWLNSAGYRVMAWDQRSGGERFGHSNRTVDKLAADEPPGYCEVYPDLQAALDYAVKETDVGQVMVWGSSYSASLVYRLAADNSDRVSAVIAASPAAGGPMVDCRARMWADQVRAPVLVLRPDREMENDSVIEQRDILRAAGAEFWEVENGVHGSSMFHEDRTGHDMSALRDRLIAWLSQAGATC